MKNDGWFNRYTHNNIKRGIGLNINSNPFKDSIVKTSRCKYWRINFDPDDKDDKYMILTQSSKEQYIAECDGRSTVAEDDGVSFFFYYTINTETQTKLYCGVVMPA